MVHIHGAQYTPASKFRGALPGRGYLAGWDLFFPRSGCWFFIFFVLRIYCIYNSRNFYRSLGRLFLNYLSFKESGFPLARQHLLSETTPCAGSALHCFSSQKLGELCTHLIVRKTDDNM